MIHHGIIVSSFSDRKIGKSRRRFSCVDICKDIVAVGSTDGNIELFQIKNFDMRQSASPLAHIVLPTVFSDVLLSLKSSPSQNREISSRSVTAIRLSSCLTRLAFGTALGDVYVFNIQNIHSISLLGSHSDHRDYRIHALSWSPNSEFLVSGCESGRVIEWVPVISKVGKGRESDSSLGSTLSTSRRDSQPTLFSWAKSLLGMRSGTTLHSSSSPIGQLDVAARSSSSVQQHPADLSEMTTNVKLFRSDNIDSAGTVIERYLLLVTTGDQSILLDVQRYFSGKHFESSVLKTVRIEPGIVGSQSRAASLFADSSLMSIYKKTNGFISCRKGSSSGPEIVYCDINGENFKLFNVKSISRRMTEPKECSNHIAQNIRESTDNYNFLSGFKYVASSDNHLYRRMPFLLTDNGQLCVIDINGMSMQYLTLFSDSVIDRIALSNNKLLILRHDKSGSSFIDHLEIISPASFACPVVIYNSSIYRAIRRLQSVWRQRRTSSDVWNKIVYGKAMKTGSAFHIDSQGKSLSSSRTESTLNEEDDDFENFREVTRRSRVPSRSSSTSIHDEISVISQPFDKIDAMIEKALNIADAEMESAVFSDNNSLTFSNFYSGESGLSWSIDQIALYGLPITTDAQGRVKSLPEDVVEQLKSLHACISDDKDTNEWEIYRRKALNEVIDILDGDIESDMYDRLYLSSYVGNPSVSSIFVPNPRKTMISSDSLKSGRDEMCQESTCQSDVVKPMPSRNYGDRDSLRDTNSIGSQRLISLSSSSSYIDYVTMSNSAHDSGTNTAEIGSELVSSAESTLRLSEIVLRTSAGSMPVLRSAQIERKLEVLLMNADALIASTGIQLIDNANDEGKVAVRVESAVIQKELDYLGDLDQKVDGAAATIMSLISQSIQDRKSLETSKVEDCRESLHVQGNFGSPSPSVSIYNDNANQSIITEKAYATYLDSKTLTDHVLDLDHQHVANTVQEIFNDSGSDASNADFLHESSTCWIESWWTEPIGKKVMSSESSVKSRICTESHQSAGNVSPTDIADFADSFVNEPMTFTVDLFAPMGLGISLLISADGNLTVKSFKRVGTGDKGPAELSGLISIGDQIIEINGDNLENFGVEKLSEVLHNCTLNPGFVSLKMRSHFISSGNSLQLCYSTLPLVANPLLDLFGPSLSLSVGDVMDSADEDVMIHVSSEISKQNVVDELKKKLEALGLYIGVLGDEESNYGLSPRLSHRSLSGLDARGLKECIYEQIRSNHIYPDAAIISCMLHDIERSYAITPSVHVSDLQRLSTDNQLSPFFADTKYPKLIRSSLKKDRPIDDEICHVFEVNKDVMMKGLEAVQSGHNVYNFQDEVKSKCERKSTDQVQDCLKPDQLHSRHDFTSFQALFKMYNLNNLKEDLTAQEKYFNDVLFHLQSQSRVFSNRSLRGYLKQKSLCLKIPTIDINRRSLSSILTRSDAYDFIDIIPVDISYGAELGIYLPDYKMTLHLYLYIIKMTNILEDASIENQAQLQQRIITLFEEWFALFIPLNAHYRIKLWSSALSEDYCQNHGFVTAQDMRDYIRLVNDLISLYFGIKSIGYPLLDTVRFPEPKKPCWAKFFSGGIVRNISLDANMLEVAWSEEQSKSFLYKYGAYLHLDFCLHVGGIRKNAELIHLVLKTATYGNEIDIATNALLNCFDSKEVKYVSARIVYKTIIDAVTNESAVMFCSLFHMLGSLFRREDKLACELAAIAFPSIGPWIVKYVLFGDHWSTALMFKFQLSSGLEDTVDNDPNTALSSWHRIARLLYQNYLQIIVKRYRCNLDQVIVMEWLELLLCHAYLDSLEDIVLSLPRHSSYLQQILSIVQHADIYNYDPLRTARLCFEYKCFQGFVECYKCCFVIAFNQGSSLASENIFIEFEPCLIESLLQASKNLYDRVTSIRRLRSPYIDDNSNGMAYSIVQEINIASEDFIKAMRLLWISKTGNCTDSDVVEYISSVLNSIWLSLSENLHNSILEMFVVSENDQRNVRSSVANAFAAAIVVGLSNKALSLGVLAKCKHLTNNLSLPFFQWFQTQENCSLR